MSFLYALIPVDAADNVETRTGDGSGGLENDKFPPLVKSYFGKVERVLSQAEETRAVELIRAQAKATGLTDEQINSLDPATLKELAQTASCDIIALVVPMPKNAFKGVSMYINGQASAAGASVNKRATAICRACGNKEATVHGDAFISRIYDNENSDEAVSWRRIDFRGDEADPSADWCLKAREVGGGGASGSGGMRSLSGMMNSMGNQPQGAPSGVEEVHEEPGYSWSQTTEEVEVAVPLPKETPKKSVLVSIRYNHVKVAVKGGEIIVDGALAQTVEEDDCTWTREGDTVTLSLCKKTPTAWLSLLADK